ncbi:MAG: PQQ-dependent sugar dehydrogenase [Rubrobacteraceae bacterium]
MRTIEQRKSLLSLLATCAALLLLAAACSSSTAERPESGTVEGGGTSRAESPEPSGSTGRPAPAQETTSETASEPAPEATDRGPVEVQFETVATGLEAPWGLVFLLDGRALVTERDSGRVLTVDEQGGVSEVQQIPEGGSGEGGLLGLALSPDYENDGYIYVYYTTEEDNRVGRFRLGEQPEPILTGIPVNTYHDGGRIAFGPDGMLYVATGDAGVPQLSQDLGSLAGKILRMTPEGNVPDDNPFPDNFTYSYGHRNVQGLAWDEEGRLFASEFGENAYDEVNLIESGGNYGWPEIEGEGGEPEYIDPIAVFDPSEASPSGAEIPLDSAIPQWNGDFLVAALRGERMWRLSLGSDGSVTASEELLGGDFGRLRHVAQAPDGSLWVLTNNRDGRGSPAPEDDRILRLAPAES